ncbi:MAG: hypothetical protein IK139_04685 [Lachnospiraceae bacterium]|nr:hypothetical protein [Lachnospiraceae bacterium]
MPRKQAEYPDWVMKYKTKGTYINKVGDKYYLYAAHSERIKGTDKVRRVSDGYIGRITQKDGLIRSKPRLKRPPVALELGLSYIILYSTKDISKGIHKSYRKNADLVYCCSILTYIYGSYSYLLYKKSFLSLRFPEVTFPDRFPPAVITGIERGCRMICDSLSGRFGDDLESVMHRFADIRLIDIDGFYYLSGHDDETDSLSEKYGIKWEDPVWQR